VSRLLVHPAAVSDENGTRLRVTPASAGWRYVGFEVLDLADGQCVKRPASDVETCIVVLSGHCDVHSEHGAWRGLGERSTPFSGLPWAAYLPPRTRFEIVGWAGSTEVAICTAPAGDGAAPRVLDPNGMTVELRGHGAQERRIHPILMGDQPADALLVCEVLTPAGHWSSYPPHKHDRDAMPDESLLEETYYHRIEPRHGFGLQRVYTDDRELDESVAFGDRDVVLVPRGYHTVSAPPGYDLYYLNVMAGPQRAWAIANDPAHEWLASPPGSEGGSHGNRR
jgi:5-deoxy-glucuronate isomerase